MPDVEQSTPPPPQRGHNGTSGSSAHLHSTAADLATLAILDSQIDAATFGEQNYHTNLDVSEKTGWSPEELNQLWLWASLPPIDPDQALYTDSDVEGLGELRQFAIRENMDADSMASLIRSIGTSAERLAVWQVESLVKHLARSRNLGDTAARMEAAKFLPEQTSMLQFLIQKLWTRHYAATIHRLTTETILRRGVSDDDQQYPLTCAVGFGWVIDFQEHTKDYPLHDFGEFARRFHDQAADIVNLNGGRVINNTGDFVVFVAPRPETGADIALELAAMHGPDFSAHMQVGMVWSRILSSYGDIYGPGVNLAALLSKAAPADGVLTDPDTAASLRRNPRYTLEQLPETELKGAGTVTPVLLALS